MHVGEMELKNGSGIPTFGFLFFRRVMCPEIVEIVDEEDTKPLVFPDGSIELDHSDITLTKCSSFVRIAIHHQPGFFYEAFLRDCDSCASESSVAKAKVLQSRIIDSYECSENLVTTIYVPSTPFDSL